MPNKNAKVNRAKRWGNACVLGASSDIAQALLPWIAPDTEDLYLTARQPQKLSPIKEQLEASAFCRVHLLELDVLDFGQSQKKIETLFRSPIELFICMPGYAPKSKAGWVEAEETARIINTNYTALVLLLNQAAVRMERQKKGMIVAVSSVAGERCRKKHYLYGSAKAAFTAYLSGLRSRLYPSGVHVMTVLPGLVQTKMLDAKKYPLLLTVSPQKAAKYIYKGIRNKKDVLYITWLWRWLVLALRFLPEGCFKRLGI